MQEVELYKLLATKDNKYDTYLVEEFKWIADNEFLVWVSYNHIGEFMNALKDLFGHGLFDDGGIDGNLQSDCVCFDLCDIIEGYDVRLTEVFPRDKYSD